MNITCDDRERIFENGTPAEWAALEAHATSCALCGEEVRAWESVSAAAQELRDYSSGPVLWPRIERALADQAAAGKRRAEHWRSFSILGHFSLNWQTVAASALVVLLTVSAGWFALHPRKRVESPDRSLLKSGVLAEVERTQAAYVKAIDKLAVDAKPQLEHPATPLLANYREKLLVLDSAIDDLRSQAGMNPSNAHLRYQLLAMYQQKQETLEEVLEARQP